jgi:hypothetical protein
MRSIAANGRKCVRRCGAGRRSYDVQSDTLFFGVVSSNAGDAGSLTIVFFNPSGSVIAIAHVIFALAHKWVHRGGAVVKIAPSLKSFNAHKLGDGFFNGAETFIQRPVDSIGPVHQSDPKLRDQ